MAGVVLQIALRHGGLAALFLIAVLGHGAEFEIGIIFLLMQWSALCRLLAAPRVDRARPRRFLLKWQTISAVGSLLLLAVPLTTNAMSAQAAAWLFIGLVAAYCATVNYGVAAWFPLIHAIIPRRLRGRYFASMRRAWQLGVVVALILAGWLLGASPGPMRFYVILIPAVLLQFVRVLVFRRLPDPAPATESEEPFWANLLHPLRDRAFAPFVLFSVLVMLAEAAAAPFVVPYLCSSLGFPVSMTVYATTCMGIGAVLTIMTWGRLADRLGNRFVFMVSLLTTGLAFMLLLLVPDYGRAPAASFAMAIVSLLLLGSGFAGIGIAQAVRLMHLTPPDRGGAYLNSCQAIIGIVGGLAAAFAGALLEWLPPVVSVAGVELRDFHLLFVAATVGLVATAAMTRRLPPIHEPRLREILALLVAALPGPIAAPVQSIHRTLRRGR